MAPPAAAPSKREQHRNANLSVVLDNFVVACENQAHTVWCGVAKDSSDGEQCHRKQPVVQNNSCCESCSGVIVPSPALE
eukprot:4794658-Amphidinium_carterae.1